MSASSISQKLLHWHSGIERSMPWKETLDPYKIWLSEIILQQTRVAQGLPYYLAFIEAYPTIQHLAKAPLDDVLKLWQGLGYYSRARNLHFAANQVLNDFNGIFPTNYTDVLSLKGVGKYTAAAIMSFAYGERYPVVDGNVLRVVSRLFGITDAVDTTSVVKEIYTLSDSLIANVSPSKYNQAVMDLGALVCTPKLTKCEECPLSEDCVAKKQDLVSVIPFKSKKINKRNRYFHYLQFLSDDGNTWIKQRGDKDIWQGLFDFPMVEKSLKGKLTQDEWAQKMTDLGIEKYEVTGTSEPMKHILSHQTIFATFYTIRVEHLQTHRCKKIKHSDIDHYALPVLMTNYLNRLR